MPSASAEQPAVVSTPPTRRHSRWSAAIFAVKRKVLQARRWAMDKKEGVRAVTIVVGKDDYPHLLAEHVSPLWTETAVSEQRLQFGKAQNLRVAVRRLNGATLPANARDSGKEWTCVNSRATTIYRTRRRSSCSHRSGKRDCPRC